MHNIYLIGFMGCGKTSTATYLERTYGMPRIEMDRDIEADCGKPIPQIFAEDGEEFFREKETQLLRKISEKEEIVISCGGGVPLRQENLEIMKASGKIVYLKASPSTILDHVSSSDKRPLLEGKKNLDDIGQMMSVRTPIYEAAADCTVVTDGKTVAQVSEEVLKLCVSSDLP